MLRILILEDSPERLSQFNARFRDLYGKPYRIWKTDSVSDAIRWLQEDEFDLVFLDHDLKPEHYVGSRHAAQYSSGTGLEVASFLKENPDVACRHKRYFVHSLNYEGRQAMLGRILSANVLCAEAPFIWTESKFLEYKIPELSEKGDPP